MTAPDTAATRLISADLMLERVAPDGASVPLATASHELRTAGTKSSTLRGLQMGLWEAGPGVDTDIENDEIFLVLAGEGTVSFEDGSYIGLRPGVLVELHEGDRTRWDITERLRKIYLA